MSYTSKGKILEKNYPEGATRYNIDNNYKKFDPKLYKKISEKLSLPLHLMLFNISGDANIALSIRTAAVYGCSDVWIVGKKKFNKRAMVGAHHYINIHKIATVDNAFFIKHKLQPFVIEQNGVPIEEVKFKYHMNNNKKACLIVGSEVKGVPIDLIKLLKTALVVSISQYGMIKSLNVSIASSIAIYEYTKQLRL
jgi:tRNA G18 (ribose-2'-O)-methylase SpoU